MEKINVLLWSVGRIEKLELPRQSCDVPRVQAILPHLGTSWSSFIGQARLRPTSEILDETDLIYRIDWAVVESTIRRGESGKIVEVVPEPDREKRPFGLDPGVVYERHYALNWLTFYADAWDDITCDT